MHGYHDDDDHDNYDDDNDDDDDHPTVTENHARRQCDANNGDTICCRWLVGMYRICGFTGFRIAPDSGFYRISIQGSAFQILYMNIIFCFIHLILKNHTIVIIKKFITFKYVDK